MSKHTDLRSNDSSKTSKSCINLKLESYDLLTLSKLGYAVIFNNENFEDKDLGARTGTNKDADSMKELLKEIGFETIDVYDDFTDIKAKTKLKEIAGQDGKDYSCFLAVFLSHGDTDKVVMTEGQLQIEDDILALFRGNKCKAFLRKPKIFIFQACRGTKREVGVDVEDQPQTDFADARSEEVEEEGVCAVTPAGADFLVCYATTNGYVSYRNIEDGSWFIENFVNVTREYMVSLKTGNVEELDFLSLVTLVADNVARKRNWDAKHGCYRIQMPCVVSTLKRRIYFPKLTKDYQTIAKNPESDENDKNSGDVTRTDDSNICQS